MNIERCRTIESPKTGLYSCHLAFIACLANGRIGGRESLIGTVIGMQVEARRVREYG